jgi:hypothetical protein
VTAAVLAQALSKAAEEGLDLAGLKIRLQTMQKSFRSSCAWSGENPLVFAKRERI